MTIMKLMLTGNYGKYISYLKRTCFLFVWFLNLKVSVYTYVYVCIRICISFKLKVVVFVILPNYDYTLMWIFSSDVNVIKLYAIIKNNKNSTLPSLNFSTVRPQPDAVILQNTPL